MDKRIIKTKERICDALLQLMKEKKSSKITVSEIAKMQMDEAIKTLGYHDVTIKLHPKVSAVLRVNVIEA